MKILVLNCGSSSLKYQLFDMDKEKVLAKGLVEKIGMEGSLLVHQPAGHDKIKMPNLIPDHNVAIELVVKALIDPQYGVIKDMNEIDAVGHRTYSRRFGLLRLGGYRRRSNVCIAKAGGTGAVA